MGKPKAFLGGLIITSVRKFPFGAVTPLSWKSWRIARPGLSMEWFSE
jgi:hypothetical protein